MMKFFVDRYLKKHDIKVATEKELEGIAKYRATRGQLKKLTDDYNDLVGLLAENATAKVLREQLRIRKVDVENLSKEELQKLYVETYNIEFKKVFK